VDGSLEFLIFDLILNGLHHVQGDGLSWLALEHQETQRADFELIRIRIRDFGGGADLTTQRALDNGFESGFAPHGEGLRLDEEIIGKIKSGFHMGHNMDIWVYVKLLMCLASLAGAFSAAVRIDATSGGIEGEALAYDDIGRAAAVIHSRTARPNAPPNRAAAHISNEVKPFPTR